MKCQICRKAKATHIARERKRGVEVTPLNVCRSCLRALRVSYHMDAAPLGRQR